MSRVRVAWVTYGAVAAALALLGIAHWIWAITLRGPVLYGEGAVANAAILARDHLQYDALARWQDGAPIFTAANYPPLFFQLASLGDDPFVSGRIASIAATLFVAAAIARRARPGGWLAAVAIALAWLGSVPVLQWGSAVKPDLVALAFTVAAVMALDASKPRHVLAGALIGLAVMTKPTALLPALAMFVFVARRDPIAAARALVAGAVAAVVVMIATGSGPNALALHVIEWNALPWRVDLAASLLSSDSCCSRCRSRRSRSLDRARRSLPHTPLVRSASSCWAAAKARPSTTSSTSRRRSRSCDRWPRAAARIWRPFPGRGDRAERGRRCCS